MICQILNRPRQLDAIQPLYLILVIHIRELVHFGPIPYADTLWSYEYAVIWLAGEVTLALDATVEALEET
jgi:hypothetical protein